MASAYLSHHIRGPLGDNSTPESREANKKEARFMALQIREAFPELDLYVPGEHDEVVEFLFADGSLTDEQILKADCAIIDKRDFVIIYNQYDDISKGMEVELNHAMHAGKAWLCMKTLAEGANKISGLISFYDRGDDDA